MVEQCFATLAVMAQCWEDSASEENGQDGSSQLWLSGQATMMRAFSDLLQHVWLRSAPLMVSLEPCIKINLRVNDKITIQNDKITIQTCTQIYSIFYFSVNAVYSVLQ